MMKTPASIVENSIIQRYFQREYVNKPATRRKKEYHRRVSPIVLIGGRSSVVQSIAIKPPMPRMANNIVAIATVLRSFFIIANMADVVAISTTIPAHKGKIFHPILLNFSVLSFLFAPSPWSSDKEKYGTYK